MEIVNNVIENEVEEKLIYTPPTLQIINYQVIGEGISKTSAGGDGLSHS